MVRVGIIGVGGMGAGHCKVVSEHPKARLTAVCDVSQKTAEERGDEYNAKAFVDYNEMLDSGLIDLVIIATPHFFHPDATVAAFERGIHVLCEKPLAVTVSEGDRMIEAAKKSGLIFSVNFQTRSFPTFDEAKRIINEGLIGEIRRTYLLSSWIRTQYYYDSGSWRATWKGEGGGVLLNQAVHGLDVLAWLAGLPVKITARTNTRMHDIEVEDEAYAFLEYKNGAHGYIYASTFDDSDSTYLEICGEKGKLKITNDTLEFFEYSHFIPEFIKNTESVWDKFEVKQVPVTITEESNHRAVIQNTIDSIADNVPLIVPGAEGLLSLELINAMLLSSKRDTTVTLPVDRAEYDQLLKELITSSKPKQRVVSVRETDPKFNK